jgi:hypothetical protein
MTVEDLAKNLEELVRKPPKEKLLLTKDGKPFAFVSDASIYDEEDIGYMTDPEFWKMISQRRRERGGIPLEQVMRRIERDERKLKARGKLAGNGKAKGKKKGSRS